MNARVQAHEETRRSYELWPGSGIQAAHAALNTHTFLMNLPCPLALHTVFSLGTLLGTSYVILYASRQQCYHEGVLDVRGENT